VLPLDQYLNKKNYIRMEQRLTLYSVFNLVPILVLLVLDLLHPVNLVLQQPIESLLLIVDA